MYVLRNCSNVSWLSSRISNSCVFLCPSSFVVFSLSFLSPLLVNHCAIVDIVQCHNYIFVIEQNCICDFGDFHHTSNTVLGVINGRNTVGSLMILFYRRSMILIVASYHSREKKMGAWSAEVPGKF